MAILERMLLGIPWTGQAEGFRPSSVDERLPRLVISRSPSPSAFSPAISPSSKSACCARSAASPSQAPSSGRAEPKSAATSCRPNLREDTARSVHLAGSLALIWSLAHLPLALVTTIEFSGPLFAAILLFLALRRRPGTGPAVGLVVLATGIGLWSSG
jgi:hypothetical protein